MYTYLIGWSQQNKWYYGVRYAMGCKPSELWRTYFTSSQYVAAFRKEFGEPDIIKIRKIFTCKDKAILWENKVLKRMNVIYDEKWLNRTNNLAIRNGNNRVYGDPWNKGKSIPRTQESIEKQRSTMIGKKRGPYTNYNYEVGAKSVIFRGKEYPSITAARNDTGVSFYTVKRYAASANSVAISNALTLRPLL
jgi:hypothetical protein